MKINLLLLAVALMAPALSRATPVTAVFTGSASGSLDGVTFDRSSFVFTGLVESSIDAGLFGVISSPFVSAWIEIDGLGTYQFERSLVLISHVNSHGKSTAVWDILGYPLMSYGELPTEWFISNDNPYGPATVSTFFGNWHEIDVATTGGRLLLDPQTGRPGTFAAVDGWYPPTEIPEPASPFLLTGLSVLGLVALRRKGRADRSGSS